MDVGRAEQDPRHVRPATAGLDLEADPEVRRVLPDRAPHDQVRDPRPRGRSATISPAGPRTSCVAGPAADRGAPPTIRCRGGGCPFPRRASRTSSVTGPRPPLSSWLWNSTFSTWIGRPPVRLRTVTTMTSAVALPRADDRAGRALAALVHERVRRGRRRGKVWAKIWFTAVACRDLGGERAVVRLPRGEQRLRVALRRGRQRRGRRRCRGRSWSRAPSSWSGPSWSWWPAWRCRCRSRRRSGTRRRRRARARRRRAR